MKRFISLLNVMSVFVVGAAGCRAAAPASALPARAGRSADAKALRRFEFVQLHMGVRVRLVVYARDQASAEAACASAFRRIAALEAVMSDYRPDSEVMRLCARAGGPPVPVSGDLFRILQHALDLARRSDGAFDPTVGPLIRLWRQARKSAQLPPEAELQQARALVGWRNVRLDPATRTVQLLIPGMRLDLGGIAKGFAADAALNTLRRAGITSALFEAGGDIAVSGAPPGRQGWRIEVPGAGPGGTVRILTLANAAISTSGDTEQFVEIDGRRYSHIVDPRTGLGLTTRVEVTVVARDGVTSDGLSTAACVLGPERGQALVASFPGAVAYFRMASD